MSSNIEIQKICQHCGAEFTAQKTTTRYCSHKCASRAYKVRKRAEKIGNTQKQTISVKTRPIAEVNEKAFLSISETCQLIGVSRRTLYRIIKRNELNTGKIGRRTIIRRVDIDKLFTQPQPDIQYSIKDCYTIGETQSKFGISEKALYEIIKRNNIPKIKHGKYTYIPKTLIQNILSYGS